MKNFGSKSIWNENYRLCGFSLETSKLFYEEKHFFLADCSISIYIYSLKALFDLFLTDFVILVHVVRVHVLKDKPLNLFSIQIPNFLIVILFPYLKNTIFYNMINWRRLKINAWLLKLLNFLRMFFLSQLCCLQTYIPCHSW